MSQLRMSCSCGSLVLNDGRSIPSVGLGVYQSEPGSETYDAVAEALRLGYRHVDTAAFYDNEADVGRAVRDSGVDRDAVWVTSKLWPYQYDGRTATAAYEFALSEAENSLELLGIEYIDMYLIHAPPERSSKYDVRAAMWRAMEEVQRRGWCRSIGVSNYGEHHLMALIDSPETTVVPAVNQIEIHPFLRRDALAAKCAVLGIAVQAYSPLAKARRLTDERLVSLALTRGMSSAQLMLRWALQRGYIVLPKSVTPSRIAENLRAATAGEWELSDADMAELGRLDEHLVTGWDPTVQA